MTSKAFVETTVLVDALLKEGPKKQAAKAALGKFDETLLPEYALKEFKGGPLKYFVWTHNKLVDTKSYQATLAAVQKVAMSPQRYLPATALEALTALGEPYKKLSLAELVEKYGEDAKLDAVLYDHARFSLKRRIARAWKQRRNVTTKVVCELPCYIEPAPKFEDSGQLDLAPFGCIKDAQCCIANAFNGAVEVKKLEQSISGDSPRKEDKRRKAALKLVRLGRLVSDVECRHLGDAVFALQCPADATILTTNVRDHRPLATAIGKNAVSPEEIT